MIKVILFVNVTQEEELQSTSRNYEHQLRVVSEHVAALNDRLAEKTRRK